MPNHRNNSPALFALAAFCTLALAQVAGASFPGKKEFGEESIHAIVENTHLVFAAEVLAIEYRCLDEPRSNAYVTVGEIDCWSGYLPAGSEVRIHGVVMEGCDAPIDPSRPNPIEVGSRYLFLCNRAWSWDTHEWLDELFVPVRGLLCLDEEQEFSYCGGGFRFSFENPGKKLKLTLDLLRLEQMEQDADLVVVATDFKVPDQADDFRYAQIEYGTGCKILKVIKGKCSESALVINPRAGEFGVGSFYRALISSTDTAVLFLKKDSRGFGLMYGAKSYCPLNGQEILSNYRLPLGARLVGNEIVRTGY